MECNVHSPCGAFTVTLTVHGEDAATVAVRHKATGNPFDLRLGPREVDAITTAAECPRSFQAFVNMIHAALVGSSGSVSYSLACEGDAAALLTLSYTVDFTAATFVLPLGALPLPPGPSGPSDEATQVARLKALLDETVLANTRLSEENAAMRHLAEERLAEMRRLCAGLNRGSAGTQARREAARGKQEADRLQADLRRARDEIGRLQRELRHRSPTPGRGRFDTPPRPARPAPTPRTTPRSTPPRAARTPSPRGAELRPRSRFDTPPTAPRRHGTPPPSPSPLAKSRAPRAGTPPRALHQQAGSAPRKRTGRFDTPPQGRFATPPSRDGSFSERGAALHRRASPTRPAFR